MKAYKIILFGPFARNKNCIIYQQIIQPTYLIIFLPTLTEEERKRRTRYTQKNYDQWRVIH